MNQPVKKKKIMLTINDVECRGQRVLIREDFNVPLEHGHITSEARIIAALPTIQMVLQKGGAVVLFSHLGRPKEGVFEERFSLKPVATALAKHLGQPVHFIENWRDGFQAQIGEVYLCENVRFNIGEQANDPELAKQLANLGDVYVMDAFATAHRAHVSTYGIAKFVPVVCAGPLLCQEITVLESAMSKPKRPVVAIVGGAKVSSKLAVLYSLIQQVDKLILGGGMANTFLLAKGYKIGQSICEPDFIEDAQELMARAEESGVALPLLTDAVVAEEFSPSVPATIKKITDIDKNDMILDIGPQTARYFAEYIRSAQSILWNGPMGVFEWPAFAEGTKTIARSVANSQAYSIAGGGDTIAAIEHFNIRSQISYVSTGGGAFLEFIEGKVLPGIAVLMTQENES